MPSCSDKTLATVGGILALPAINAAAGSSLLSLALLGLVACAGCLSCLGEEGSRTSSYAFGALALVDLILIAVSGAAGYETVDRGDSQMNPDQALASTVVGVCSLLAPIGLAILGRYAIDKIRASELSHFTIFSRRQSSVPRASAITTQPKEDERKNTELTVVPDASMI
jgi:hypothetical protein